MSDATVVTTVGPPLGYLVGFRRPGGEAVILPSFPAIRETREEAAEDLDILQAHAPADEFVLLEVREAAP